jgi:hypothetical protein
VAGEGEKGVEEDVDGYADGSAGGFGEDEGGLFSQPGGEGEDQGTETAVDGREEVQGSCVELWETGHEEFTVGAFNGGINSS